MTNLDSLTSSFSSVNSLPLPLTLARFFMFWPFLQSQLEFLQLLFILLEHECCPFVCFHMVASYSIFYCFCLTNSVLIKLNCFILTTFQRKEITKECSRSITFPFDSPFQTKQIEVLEEFPLIE